MATKEEIQNTIKDYEAKYKATRNSQEKAVYGENIKKLKKELKKLDEKPLVKDYVPNRDVPSVADKQYKGEVVRGMITGGDRIAIEI